MGTRTSRRAGAFTLLEVLLVSALLSIILIVAITSLASGLRTSSRSATQGMVQEEARHVVEAIVRELKDSGEECTGWEIGLNPDPSSQYYEQEVSRIGFSRCVGYDPALEMLQWGPVATYEFEAPVGEEPGKLARTENGVRVIVCDYVSAFTVCYMPGDSLLVITLTVQREDPESRGDLIRASYTASVRLRN